MRLPYRLGLDIGTNSLGWCALGLDVTGELQGVHRLGVRIFSDGRDPQSGTSLAVDRRVPRQQRRRRDRYLDRRQDLMKALARHGLMLPNVADRKKLEAIDPYELRARGLDQALTLHELGRAVFHLNQRRGFKSNRKTDKAKKADANEAKGMKAGILGLRQRMEASGARTLGEYLHRAYREGRSVRQQKAVRAKPRRAGSKVEYDIYPDRAMYEAEFDALWVAQKRFHPELSDQARDDIRDIVFFQRPLKPVDPGKCTLDPSEKRAPLALPLAQCFRMYQELANLKIVLPDQTSRHLDKAQRDRAFAKLERTKELSFDGLRRLLNLGSETRFNLEDEKRSGLKGDATGLAFAKKGRFGSRWWNLSGEDQNAIVQTLLDEASEERIVAIAMGEWGCGEDEARAVADATLLEGYVRFGRTALGKIVPLLIEKGFSGYMLPQAVQDAGYLHHSDFRTGEIFDHLPYYGQVLERYVAWGSGDPADPEEKRIGRIANPTVHIALNQLRKLINALIEEYGHPEQVVVELARDLKLGAQQKDEIRKRQADEQKRNDERRKKLNELGLAETGENLMRLRLWEELNPKEPHNRRCVYTGEMISIHRLFEPEVEIEHILPFKRTLDNSAANRTVSLRRANRDKGNNSPYEAFGHSPPGYDWAGILARANDLPRNKRWRFAADAMEKFAGERDFLDRQLTDTAYLSRITREYLTAVCDPNKVWVSPGRLTEMMRGRWGLNKLLSDHNLKNRVDHRHHAIDAFVIGVTDRGLLQRIASAADQHRERLIEEMPDPWPGFRDELRAQIDRIVVSHKPDHGKSGKLHEETAHGILADPSKEDDATLVYRKAFDALNDNEIARIRDRALRAKVQDWIKEAVSPDKPLKQALAEFGDKNQVRRVRLLKTEEKFVAIKDADGASYKAYIPGDNHHIDIYERADGRLAGEAVTMFDANQNGHSPRWRADNPGARLFMRVHKGDLVKLEHDGQERIMRVVRLEAKAERLRLAEHRESGDLARRHDDRDDPFRWLFVSFNQLKVRRARKVAVDITGRVHDPGPPG